MKNILFFCSLTIILGAIFFCTHDTLYTPDNSPGVTCHAFLSDTLVSQTATLNEVSGLPVIDTIHTKDSIVFVGIIDPLSGAQKLKKWRWSFGDNDSSNQRIVKHAFTKGGVYRGIFTIEDNAGFTMSDTVVVHVNTRPCVDTLLLPYNGQTGINPKDPRGIYFSWSCTDSDNGDTVLSDLYISTDTNFMQPNVSGIAVNFYEYKKDIDILKTFYWRIVVRDRYNDRDSSVIYRFSTKDPNATDGALKGYAAFKGWTNHSGIKITITADGAVTRTATTTNTGYYEIPNVTPKPSYRIIADDEVKNEFVSDTVFHPIIIGEITVADTLILKDIFKPVISNNSPTGTQTIRQPQISVSFSDIASGILKASAVITVNDSNHTKEAVVTSAGLSWTPGFRFPDGEHRVKVTVSDSAGNKADPKEWTFFVDAMKLYAMQDTAVIINSTVFMHGRVSDVYSKVAQYKWDFNGDGIWEDSVATSDSAISRPWAYTHEDTFQAILYARDDSGTVKKDTSIIIVGNMPPVIDSIRPDTTISIYDSVPFYGKAHDVDGTIKEYAWDFNGDGTFEFSSGATMNAGYKYIPAGVYKAILRVIDDDNKQTKDTVIITVAKGMPSVWFVSKDTTVSIKDTIHLKANAKDTDGVAGTIVKWEWNIGNSGWVVASGEDTNVVMPATPNPAYPCSVRVTDDDGNVEEAAVKDSVLLDPPQIKFISPDLILDYGGTVRCSVYVEQRFGTMNLEIDTANSGNYKYFSTLGIAGGVAYPFSTGNACSWDSVKARAIDDDGNIIIRGFKVDIRPRALTINSIDSTINTITVNYTQTQESDFAEYRIYRNTNNDVDSLDELWATITSSGITSCTTPSPSYAWAPRYYRIYQKDNEGLWSAGSNIVYGNIINSPPTTPVITYPVNNGDSIWSNEIIRWTCSDPNGHAVRYDVFVNYNDTGYHLFKTALQDTFVRLSGYDSLFIRWKVIAYDSVGDSSGWSLERTAIIRRLLSDIEGNIYHAIRIGNQVWTVENWRSTKYNDGTAIPHVTDSTAWYALTTPGYCYYNNATDANTIKKWGALYNWYVVSPTNPKQIAPAGWHVPSDSEWTVLENYLIANGYNWDGTTTGNKIAKSMAAQTDWNQVITQPGTIGNDLSKNNASGFSALPGGYRYGDGNFSSQSYYGYWWSATEGGASYAWYRHLYYYSEYLYRGGDNEGCGFSVRLLRDSN